MKQLNTIHQGFVLITIMSGTYPKRDDKMFFGAQTPFRPKRGI